MSRSSYGEHDGESGPSAATEPNPDRSRLRSVAPQGLAAAVLIGVAPATSAIGSAEPGRFRATLLATAVVGTIAFLGTLAIHRAAAARIRRLRPDPADAADPWRSVRRCAAWIGAALAVSMLGTGVIALLVSAPISATAMLLGIGAVLVVMLGAWGVAVVQLEVESAMAGPDDDVGSA